MKTFALEWDAFMQGEKVLKNPSKLDKMLASGFATYVVMIPASVYAKDKSSFEIILSKVWEIADYMCIGIIIFAGAKWMFGDRTKGIESLISGSVGYLIIRHARDIQHWLESI
jgi:hypothetical protein